MQYVPDRVVVNVACLGDHHRLQVVYQIVIDYGNTIVMIYELVSISHHFARCSRCSLNCCGLIQLDKFLFSWHFVEINFYLFGMVVFL